MYRKPGDPLTSGASKIANSASENGEWPRERLLAMDGRFVERVERAIAVGDESPQGAAGLGSAR